MRICLPWSAIPRHPGLCCTHSQRVRRHRRRWRPASQAPTTLPSLRSNATAPSSWSGATVIPSVEWNDGSSSRSRASPIGSPRYSERELTRSPRLAKAPHRSVRDLSVTTTSRLVELVVEPRIVLDARGIQFTTSDGFSHRAAWLTLVGAIGEPARESELLDIAEDATEAFVCIPERDRTKSRRIEQHASVGKHEELPRRRRVPSALVARAHLSHVLHFFADEAIHARRLAGAGRADQGDRLTFARVFAERTETFAGRGARDDDVDVRRDVSDSLPGECGRRGRHEIGFVEDDDGLGSALVDQHELSLEPAQVRARRQRLHHERGVDVGGDDLRAARPSVHRIAAHELRLAIED